MSRLFLTLYALIAVALGGYYVATITVPEYFLKPVRLDYAHNNYRGTLYLLNNLIRDLDEPQRLQQLAAIKRQFEYPVDLVPASTLEFSAREQRRLDKHLLVEREVDDADRGFFPSSVNGLIWRFDSDQTASEHNRRITIGTFRLVEDALRERPVEDHQTLLAELNDHFGFTVAIEPLTATRLDELQRQSVADGEVIGVNIDTDDERYYYRLNDSRRSAQDGTVEVLRFGPINFPFYFPLIVTAFIGILGAFIAIAVWIWIRPIWSNLISLGDATRRFGGGDLSARVTVRKRSGIAEASRAFNSMAERIQNLIGSHKELTNAVSHELRTPLSRLRFNIELAENTADRSDQRRYLNNMSRDIDELDSLINEMLTYARFDRDASQIRREPLELASWLRDEVSRLGRYEEKRTVGLEIARMSVPPVVLAEPRLLSRALANLVHNSLRYADNAMIRLLEDADGYVSCVDDDGPGIPVKSRESVFDAFARLDQSRNRASGGFGLGLSIVRQIVEWHHGKVTVHDAPEGGARFSLFIPACSGYGDAAD